MSAYGFTPDFHDDEQKKTRYQGEDTFMDIWEGKRGMTIGAYRKSTKSMTYEYPFRLEDVEKLLIELTTPS